MTPRLQASRAAIELIKRFEGYRRSAARLEDGRWTIGYGHTKTARQGAEVSAADAEALLIYDLMEVGKAIGESVYTPLNQNQYDALCAFVFNIGVDNFRHSAVLRRLNEGDLLRAACAMEMWRKADFDGERIVVDALIRRRAAEKSLFLTPTLGYVPAPTPIVQPRIDQDLTGAVPQQTPVEVKASLEGARATAERVEPVRPAWPAAPTPQEEQEEISASQAAAAAITARLQAILKEPEEEAAPPVAAPTPVPAETPAEGRNKGLDLPSPPEGAVWTPAAETPPPVLTLTPPPPTQPEPEPVAEAAEPIVEEHGPGLFTAPPMTFPDVEPRTGDGEFAESPYEALPSFDNVQPSRSIGVVPGLLGLAVLGLIVFAGALFWAFNAKQAGGGLFSMPVLIAGGLGVVGIGCVGLAIYFLLERLGGREEL